MRKSKQSITVPRGDDKNRLLREIQRFIDSRNYRSSWDQSYLGELKEAIGRDQMLRYDTAQGLANTENQHVKDLLRRCLAVYPKLTFSAPVLLAFCCSKFNWFMPNALENFRLDLPLPL